MRKGKDPNGSGCGSRTLLFGFYLYFILLCDSSLGNVLENRGRTSLFLRILRKWTYIVLGGFQCWPDIKENIPMTKGTMYTKDFLELGGTNFIEAINKYS
jgi:hypothetical protein